MANAPQLHYIVGQRELVVAFERGDFSGHYIPNLRALPSLTPCRRELGLEQISYVAAIEVQIQCQRLSIVRGIVHEAPKSR